MVLTQEIIAKLSELKDECGLTNEQIGKRSDPVLSAATVRRYIAGEVKDAPRETIKKIIIAMGGTPDEIISKKEDYDMEVTMLRQTIQNLKDGHKEELHRIEASHDKIVSQKDKWITRLFVLCIILSVLLFASVIWAFKLDSMISGFGLIQNIN